MPNNIERLSNKELPSIDFTQKTNPRAKAIYILSKYPLERNVLESGYGDMILEDLHRLQEVDSTVVTCLSRDAVRRFSKSDYKYFYIISIEEIFNR